MLYYTPMYVSWLITETLKISLSVRHWTTNFWNTMQTKLHLLCFPKYFGNIIINITNLCMCPVARISIWGLFFFWKRTNYFSNYCHHSGRMNFHQDHKCFTVGQMSSLCMTLKWLVRTMATQGLKRESLDQIPTCKKGGEQSELFAKMRWGPCILLFFPFFQGTTSLPFQSYSSYCLIFPCCSVHCYIFLYLRRCSFIGR